MKYLLTALPLLTALAAHGAELRIHVTVPTNKQGNVMAAVFDKADGFPRGKSLQTATAQPVDGKAIVHFANLPEGNYAVSVFLDENGNQKLDSNLFGLPTELYGFSRNARSLAGPPAFVDAVLRVGPGASHDTIELK